ncbi:DNA methylase N-4/N-6 domain protein, partial [mine drainage metagenome]
GLAEEWDDATWNIPNVKFNHPEKTNHPCQFPVELVERCVLALTDPGDWVLDPYAGVGSTAIAAVKAGRKAACVDREGKYIETARRRLHVSGDGETSNSKDRHPGLPTFRAGEDLQASRGVVLECRSRARYSFNRGREYVEAHYPDLLTEVFGAIRAVDS